MSIEIINYNIYKADHCFNYKIVSEFDQQRSIPRHNFHNSFCVCTLPTYIQVDIKLIVKASRINAFRCCCSKDVSCRCAFRNGTEKRPRIEGRFKSVCITYLRSRSDARRNHIRRLRSHNLRRSNPEREAPRQQLRAHPYPRLRGGRIPRSGRHH